MPPNPQHILLLHHLRRYLQAAADQSIDVVPFKGAHLLTSVYPTHEDRGPMADVDVLVRPEDYLRAGALAQELGFNARPSPYDETLAHEVGFILDTPDGWHVMIEIHRYLVEPARHPINHHAIWARTTPSTLDGAPCRRLAPEDHFVFLCLHATLHRLMQAPRAVRDLELLTRHEGIDHATLVQRAREWRATRCTWLFATYLEHAAPDLDLQPVTRALSPPAPVRAALHALVPAPGQTRLAGAHHRLQAALLWPLLFDSLLHALRFASNHPITRIRANEDERGEWAAAGPQAEQGFWDRLTAGETAPLCAGGGSMRPLFPSRTTFLIAPATPAELKIGDLVLQRRSGDPPEAKSTPSAAATTSPPGQAPAPLAAAVWSSSPGAPPPTHVGRHLPAATLPQRAPDTVRRHRLIAWSPSGEPITKGDSLTEPDALWPRDTIKGRAVAVVRDGQIIRLDEPRQTARARTLARLSPTAGRLLQATTRLRGILPGPLRRAVKSPLAWTARAAFYGIQNGAA